MRGRHKKESKGRRSFMEAEADAPETARPKPVGLTTTHHPSGLRFDLVVADNDIIVTMFDRHCATSVYFPATQLVELLQDSLAQGE